MGHHGICLLRRSVQEDRRSPSLRDSQERGRTFFRCRPLLGQAIREDGCREKTAHAEEETRLSPTVARWRQATLRVQEVVKERGCELLYLTPYSPGFNTIEQAFYKVKEPMRRAETRTRAALIEAMGQALRAITARVLLDHCGYRTLGQLL
jgi:hypothetical protein